MKKILVLLLAILMVFAIVSCKDEPEQATVKTPVSEDQGKDNLVDQGAKGSKALGDGFRITGTFKYFGEEWTVEIGGKDDLYWIGNNLGDVVYISEVDDVVKVYDGDWDAAYEVPGSIKEALFKDIADTVLYCSFDLFGEQFSDEVAVSNETIEGRECTKFVASYSDKTIGKILEAEIYVDTEFAITLKLNVKVADEFKEFVKKNYPIIDPTNEESLEDLLETLNFNLEYKADVDFSLSSEDLSKVTGYAEALAALSAL